MSAEVIGWIASVAYLARLVPQPVRLSRTGVPDGVAPLASMNAMISDLAWALYGLSAALLPVWSVAALGLPIGCWTVLLLRSRIGPSDVIGSALWLTLIAVSWSTGSLAIVLAASVVVNQGPQVWTAIRSRRLEGISTSTWCIAIVDASLWGGYGLACADVALVGYGVVLLASAIVILGRIWWTRQDDDDAVEVALT